MRPLAMSQRPPPAGPDADVISLLLIDDDPFALEIQAHVAADALPEARVTTVVDPRLAIEMSTAQVFDCVLLDYDMPTLDGLEVAARLRSLHRYLPIVLCTGAGDEMLVAKALQNGITDYITKSAIRPPSLRRVVLHAIQIAASTRLIDEQRAELETFAFALAHDFKQPLRQITTFADMSIQDIDDQEFDEARKHLKFLGSSARRLSALVDMMSQYTLLNKPLVLEPVRVGAVVDGVLELLATYIADREGSVQVVGDAFVQGNSTFLHQILQNLVVNGLKYNESAAPKVVVRTTPRAGSCSIEVTDNGIGISPDYLEQVFRPLARLHTSTEYSGTGLGLTLARKAAAAQGGAVVCRSELGVGSTFDVTLPLAAQPQRLAG